jgi:hypothetical protein
MSDSNACGALADPDVWANPARRADLFQARARARYDRAQVLRDVGWACLKVAISLDVAEERNDGVLAEDRRHLAAAAAFGVGLLEQLADELDDAASSDFSRHLEELRRVT